MTRPAFDDTDLEPAELDRIVAVLAQLEPADFERISPPAGLWKGIAASLSAPAATVVEYWIDGDDVLVEVGADWAAFAAEGDAAELADSATGRSLWSSMDDEARDLWRPVVSRVRSERAHAVVPLRCDAPGVRRWFDVTVSSDDGERVRFRSVLVWEEVRTDVLLLDDGAQRDLATEAVRICSWCNSGEHGAEWIAVEQLVAASRLLERPALPAVSYGICPSCREAMSADLLVTTHRETDG